MAREGLGKERIEALENGFLIVRRPLEEGNRPSEVTRFSTTAGGPTSMAKETKPGLIPVGAMPVRNEAFLPPRARLRYLFGGSLIRSNRKGEGQA